MRLQQQNNGFSPIAIVLETQRDLEVFWDMVLRIKQCSDKGRGIRDGAHYFGLDQQRGALVRPNVKVTGAARLHRAASVLTAGLGPEPARGEEASHPAAAAPGEAAATSAAADVRRRADERRETSRAMSQA
jgi:hypothetical protein